MLEKMQPQVDDEKLPATLGDAQSPSGHTSPKNDLQAFTVVNLFMLQQAIFLCYSGQ